MKRMHDQMQQVLREFLPDPTDYDAARQRLTEHLIRHERIDGEPTSQPPQRQPERPVCDAVPTSVPSPEPAGDLRSASRLHSLLAGGPASVGGSLDSRLNPQKSALTQSDPGPTYEFNLEAALRAASRSRIRQAFQTQRRAGDVPLLPDARPLAILDRTR